MEGGDGNEGKARGVAGDDFAVGLAFRESGVSVAEGFIAKLQDFAGGAGPVFGLEHEGEQGRMLEREGDVGLAEFDQARLEGVGAVFGGAAQRSLEAFEAGEGQCVKEGLLVGEVAARRGVADAEFAGEFAQRDAFDAIRLECFLGGIKQLGVEVAVVVGARIGRHSRDTVHGSRRACSMFTLTTLFPVDTFSSPTMTITKNTILITGGGSGIGRGLAEAFHALGNKVIITGRRAKKLEEVTNANPGMASVTLDIDNPESIRHFAEEVTSLHPALNIVINNAGIARMEDLTKAPATLADSEAIVTTNILGPIRLTHALLPHLLKQPKATIINVSSGLAFVPFPVGPTYSASKAALHSYTTVLRWQLRETSVEVKEIIPPYVQTELGGDHQLNDPRAMPLKDFIAQTMEIFKTQPDAPENCVDKAKHLRFAESKGEFDKAFNALAEMSQGRAPQGLEV